MTPIVRGKRAAAWLGACLALAAAAMAAFLGWIAASPEDAEALESPLALACARQLAASPLELYGPFGASNPYVIIHAPLYYRLAAALALGLGRFTHAPLTAALAAGRGISLVSLLGTLLAAAGLARLGGGSARAGWWAALLIVAAPVLGTIPAALRPDMLGVLLQTAGAFVVLDAATASRARGRSIPLAYVLFALAFCVKQHNLATGLVCTIVLLVPSLRGAVTRRMLERGAVLGLAVVLLILGAEEVLSQGRMGQAVFRAASNAGAVHPASWASAQIVWIAFLGRSLGLTALAVGLGLAWLGGRRGIVSRTLLATAGILLAALIAVSASQLVSAQPLQPVAQVLGVAGLLFLVLPLLLLVDRRFLLASRVDGVLAALVLAEALLAAALSRGSTGAWLNYGIQAVVYASVLLARGLDRLLTRTHADDRFSPRLVWVLIAALAPVVAAATSIQYMAGRRVRERLEQALVMQEMGGRPAEYFFVDRPGANRRNGRFDLVYDDWLYPVFETIRLAEPRSGWLAAKLIDGSVNYVVNTSDSDGIDRVTPSLPALGFVRRIHVGDSYTWERPAYARSRR